MIQEKIFNNNKIILLLIFCSIFLIYIKGPAIMSGDSLCVIPTAVSIIKEGNANLDEYKNFLNYTTEKVRGHYYMNNIGVSIIAMPFVYIFGKIFGYDKIINYYRQTEQMIAFFIVALCSVFIYLIAYQLLSKFQSLLITFIFAFCTSAWSTASRALWQHGPSMLMLTITLYLSLLAKRRPYLIQFTGIFLAFAYLIRPLNIVSFIFFTVFVVILYRKYFFYYLIFFFMIMIPFFIYNLLTHGLIFSHYYFEHIIEISSNKHFFEALLGNLLSPSRGLFIFSPILLFSIYGVVLKIKNKQFEKLDFFLIGIIFTHYLGISYISNWWSGWSIGQRYFSDMLPYFIYFLIPVLPKIFIKNMKNWFIICIFFCSVLFSFFVHYRCVATYEPWRWNSYPVEIDSAPERVWNWKDIQFLRGINFIDYEKSYYKNYLKSLEIYNINGLIRFDDSKRVVFIKGWSNPEQTYRWTNGKSAVMLLNLGNIARTKRYQLLITAQALGEQEIQIFLNDVAIGNLKLRGPLQTDYIVFPGSLFKSNGINTIKLKIPRARRANDRDPRILGLALIGFSIREAF